MDALSILQFLQYVSSLVKPIKEFLMNFLIDWWWLIAPFILWRPFYLLWHWWRNEIFFSYIKFVFLEVILPKETKKPLRAMEQVISSIWGSVYDPPDWWEEHIEGKVILSVVFEIVSLDGKIHFFIRVPERARAGVESSIYSQYPDAEIIEVDDYTKYVPQDIPNKDWDCWGFDVQLLKPEVYPIRTYEMFFEERPETTEEKRLDPLSPLLEGMTKLNKGEHMWLQIVVKPIAPADYPYPEIGKKEVNKLMKRVKEEKKGTKSLIEMIIDEFIFLFTGKKPPTEAQKSADTSALFTEYIFGLTEDERKVIAAIEKKVSKFCFMGFIRFLHVYKRDSVSTAAKPVVIGFLESLSTTNLNTMKPWGETITKVHKHWFLPYNLFLPRLLYLKKRKMFNNYMRRVPPKFPNPGGTFILNTEELATLFHFPSRDISPVPFIRRVEATKGIPPSTIPLE